jgi:hypothetical protein
MPQRNSSAACCVPCCSRAAVGWIRRLAGLNMITRYGPAEPVLCSAVDRQLTGCSAGASHPAPSRDRTQQVIGSSHGFALSIIVLIVCWMKGEPPRWRWADAS